MMNFRQPLLAIGLVQKICQDSKESQENADRRIQSVDGPPILQNIPDPSGGCITLNMVTANKFEKTRVAMATISYQEIIFENNYT